MVAVVRVEGVTVVGLTVVGLAGVSVLVDKY